MSQTLNRRIQELLRKHLGELGVAPDLRNDDQAVAKIAQELGITRDVIARELTEMRSQGATQIISRQRIAARSHMNRSGVPVPAKDSAPHPRDSRTSPH